MSFFAFISQDWRHNKGNTKGRIAAFFFRVANYARNKKVLKILFLPYLLFYKVVFEWLIGMEIPYNTIIGSGLKIFHLQSIIINKNAVIGENCNMRHSLTIGNNSGGKCPVIGNNVNIGAHVCIIGDITIGDRVTIGAGSIVVKSVPAGCTVVGNPAKVIKTEDQSV